MIVFLLITTMFTVFVCVMCFALLGAFSEMLDSVTKVVDMTQNILENGFEIEYTQPEQQQPEETEQVDNTGKITSTSEIVDGVLQVHLTNSYIKQEFENINN